MYIEPLHHGIGRGAGAEVVEATLTAEALLDRQVTITGWVYVTQTVTARLSDTGICEAEVNRANLNMRETPGQTAPVVGVLFPGDEFYVNTWREIDNAQYPLWYEVIYWEMDNAITTGWVAAVLVTLARTCPLYVPR